MKSGILLGIILIITGCQSEFSAVHHSETLYYLCDKDPSPFKVELNIQNRQVSFMLKGKQYLLSQQIAASGTRYADKQTVFWSKGDHAFLQDHGKMIFNDCQLQRN